MISDSSINSGSGLGANSISNLLQESFLIVLSSQENPPVTTLLNLPPFNYKNLALLCVDDAQPSFDRQQAVLDTMDLSNHTQGKNETQEEQ